MKNRFKNVLYFILLGIVIIFLSATSPIWAFVWVVTGYNAINILEFINDKADTLND